jgi:hypothetical protein
LVTVMTAEPCPRNTRPEGELVPWARDTWTVCVPAGSPKGETASSGRASTLRSPIIEHVAKMPPGFEGPRTTALSGVNVQTPAASTVIVKFSPSHAVPAPPVPFPTGLKTPGFWLLAVVQGGLVSSASSQAG